MSGASAEWLKGWYPLGVPPFISLPCYLGPQTIGQNMYTWPLHVTSPLHHGWLGSKSIPKKPCGSCITFYGTASLLLESYTHPDSREGNTDAILQCEECQCHTVRACGMGDLVAIILENDLLHLPHIVLLLFPFFFLPCSSFSACHFPLPFPKPLLCQLLGSFQLTLIGHM